MTAFRITLKRHPDLAAVADPSWNCMQHREEHAPSLLSGCHWMSRIAGFWVAVLIAAIMLNWCSGTALSAASSHLDSTSSSIEAVTTNPDSIAEATQGVGEFYSCARDYGAPKGHAGTCDGCCSFSSCGGVIVSAVATADHPELLAQFPSLALVAPRKLLLPPITRPPIFPLQ